MYGLFWFVFLVVGAQGSLPIPWESDVTQWNIKDLEDGECKTHLQEYIDAISHFGAGTGEYTWAAQMLDSSAKLPNGILSLNLVHMGLFDECLAVRHPTNNFQGKHCMLSMAISMPTESQLSVVEKPQFLDLFQIQSKPKQEIHNRQVINLGFAFKYGLCIPSTCNATDLNTILGKSGKITAIDENCWTSQVKPLEGLAISFITVCALFVTLVAASTLYHYTHLNQTDKKPSRLLCAFSLYENVPKLLQIRANDADNMGCLHGIRTLSMMWVMLCHTYILFLSAPIINFSALSDKLNSLSHIFISNGFASVDSFFFLSGLLVAFVFFRNTARNGSYDVLSSYIHRFIRLTPPFAMMVFATVSILPELGRGPLWHDFMAVQVDGCTESWWSTLLYVQNYVKPEAQCLGQSWYLSADMQMFWIAPLILYPILLWPVYGMAFLGLLTIGSTLWSFGLAYGNGYKASMMLPGGGVKQFMYEYVATHFRMTPWLVGIVCGVGICAIKSRRIPVRLNKMMVLLGWCCTTALCLGILMIFHLFQLDSEKSDVENALYLAFSRLGWGIGLSWIVFACIHGYGGLINSFLSMGLWQPLGKLSYSVYLIHMTILTYRTATLQTNVYLSDLDAVYIFTSTLLLSYLLSLIMYVTVEAPIVILDQEILGSVKILQFPKPKTKKPVTASLEEGSAGSQDNKE